MIPNFKSKSTVEHKDYDVEIKDIYIKTRDGEKVNVLVTDEEYIYTYTVTFNMNAENVVVTMGIQTEKGFYIGGSPAPGEKVFIEKIKKREKYLIEWYFRCNLLFGNYYISTAVKSFKDGKGIFLNRIVDAFVFKVQRSPETNYKGIVHFGQHAKITLISK